MDAKQVLSFIKIEHTLFSLPFVLIGYFIALEQFNLEPGLDLLWILLAAVGARGLAMALNRIIDRDIDAANPRTQGRHLASGAMSLQTAWTLAALFLVMLLVSAGLLNVVALMMAWLPVLAFVIYPYMKRFTWLCHFWLGLCLGLAPAGAWVAIAADVHGWASITGQFSNGTDFMWAPTILPISIGVALWIAAFDINYARMDVRVTVNKASILSLLVWRCSHNTNDRPTLASLVCLLCYFRPHGWRLVSRCCPADGARQRCRCLAHESF